MRTFTFLFMSLSIIFILFLNIGGNHQDFDDGWHLVSDLKKDWVIYDRETRLYSPFIEDIHSDFNVVNLNLDPTKHSGCYLSIKSNTEGSVFFNNKLIDYNQGGSHKKYSLDSIKGVNGDSLIFITIFLKNGNLSNLQTEIISHTGIGLSSDFQDPYHIGLLPRDPLREFLILGFVILLFSYAITLNVNRRVFRIYLDLKAALKRSSRDDYLLSQRSINNSDIANIIHVAIVGSYILVILIVFRNTLSHISGSSVTSNLMFLWLGFSTMTIFLFLVKYLGIQMMTKLFQIKEIQNMHFYEYIRLNNIFISLAFVLFQTLYFVFDISVEKLSLLILSAFTGFIIFRVISLYFKFLNSTAFKKVYLFAYLCTTEIAPALISLNLLYSADKAFWF